MPVTRYDSNNKVVVDIDDEGISPDSYEVYWDGVLVQSEYGTNPVYPYSKGDKRSDGSTGTLEYEVSKIDG